jgi:hypothetical protein
MKKIIFLIFLLWFCCAGAIAFAQEKKAPMTKQEILRLLKPVPGARSEQADLAGEINERGIAFPVDEKTIEEIRKAGARSFVIIAIQNAANAAAQKSIEPATQPETETPVNPARPRLQHKTEGDVAPPSDRPEQKEELSPEARAAALAKLPLIERARYHAGEFNEELPNFIVTQFVTRFVRTPELKDWKEEDKLEIEITYQASKGEQFKLLKLNGNPTTMNYKDLGGATSTGEFGSMLAALFSPQSQADFKEVKRETFKGRQTVVFDFRVKKAFSSNQIVDKSSGRTVVVGYQGSVWIDTETGRAMRIEHSADDIQRGFPITMAENAVEYDWVTIAGAKYLLPVFAEVILGRESERFYSRNVIELRNYRMFDTDLKILPEKDQ